MVLPTRLLLCVAKVLELLEAVTQTYVTPKLFNYTLASDLHDAARTFVHSYCHVKMA
jgi:hypothetical protein